MVLIVLNSVLYGTKLRYKVFKKSCTEHFIEYVELRGMNGKNSFKLGDNFSGRSEKNNVKGKMNGGGIPVYMHASGGNVNVSFED